MSANDTIILDQILAKRKAALDPEATDSAFWEFFTAEQILRDYSLDPEEIESGIVGQESNKKKAGNDGGIDSIYLIVNNKLIRDVAQAQSLSNHKGNIQFDVIIIQSKKHKGFDIASIVRLNNTSESIFDLTKQPISFAEKYNKPLLNAITCFREAHAAVLMLEPHIGVHYFIACAGDSSHIDANVKGKGNELQEMVKTLLSTIDECEVHLLGAQDIISIARKPRKSKFKLKCIDSITDNKGGYVALVDLDEYYRLISENGQLREYLFESNVRDYEGDVHVNRQIRHSLEHPDKDVDFWWLNNGITIVAENVGGHAPEIVLYDPQVVNGLQTSQVIFEYLREPGLFQDALLKRHVVIRIIQSPEAAIQDQIIKATNSQTQIPAEFLRASGNLQRNIEDTFHAHGLHYDRRKNSWRRSGRPLGCIVGPTELAQNVAAILLQEPDQARGRPSRYAKEDYHKVFASGIPLPTYFVCSLLRKRAEVFLRKKVADRPDRNNLLFYVMMAMRPFLLLDGSKVTRVRLQDIDVDRIKDDIFESALAIVLPIYEKHGGDDTAAKGTEMVSDLKAALKARFPEAKEDKLNL